MKTFTEDEKIIARNIDKEYQWMARDSDRGLCVYERKPKKEKSYWHAGGYDYLSPFSHLFSAVKWENEESTLISDIYNPPILNDAEREYIKMILKPFHGAVKYAEKVTECVFDEDNCSKEYLFIAFYGRGSFSFPDFDSGKMYAGMELNRKYKLDELGITYPEEES